MTQGLPHTDEAAAPVATHVRVFGPASLSNLGPGFDTLGLALRAEGLGDTVDAWQTDEPGVRVEIDAAGFGTDLPVDPALNTAAVAGHSVLRRAGVTHGMTIRIRKGFPPGSGIGSSAASAVAGAWAANLLCGSPFAKDELVDAVLDGESLASGSRHGDNVLPALFGGLVLVASSDPARYRRIDIPPDLHIAVVLPRVQVLTRMARAILPADVPLASAVHNASALAFMLEAFRAGDWDEVGRWMMQDRIVEPVRATLLPCYEAVRQAAMEAGACGCAITGSGPAMFAIAASRPDAARICEEMIAASDCMAIEATGYLCEADDDGAASIDAVTV